MMAQKHRQAAQRQQMDFQPAGCADMASEPDRTVEQRAGRNAQMDRARTLSQ